ncbi:hypothetical protein LX36DRAFT_661394 [Colletotrichum falcatum]|nr:hypothetical protein LX36DRAFT_661394 [Colletotrichum falcatum]
MTCWMVTWEAGEITRFLLAVDRSEEGFVTSLGSMNSFTNGQPHSVSSIEEQGVTASRTRLEDCQLGPRGVA